MHMGTPRRAWLGAMWAPTGRSAQRAARLHAASGAAFGAALALGAPAALAAQATVVGVVRDSLAGRPLAGATVQLVPRDDPGASVYAAESDAAGTFRLTGVPRGRYVLGFLHPRLDSLAVQAPARPVEVGPGAGEVRAELALPGARTLAAALCGARRDTTGVLIGRVLNAARGEAVATGAVAVRWAELRVEATGVRRVPRSVQADVGTEGRYAVCGVPTDVAVAVQAAAGDVRRPEGASGEIELRLDPKSPLLYRDVLVAEPVAAPAPAMAARRGTASVAGRVRRPDRSLLAGARVIVRGTGAADSVAVADSAGAFRLDALPGGTYAIEATAIGFTPARAAVDLRAGRPAVVELAVGRRVTALEKVSVYAARPRGPREFERHRQAVGWSGLGRFLTAADIRKRDLRSVAQALLALPGLRAVGQTLDGRVQLRGRGDCMPIYYLDGVRVMGDESQIDHHVPASQIGGIEVYPIASWAPAPYDRGNCASVLVWTKREVQ